MKSDSSLLVVDPTALHTHTLIMLHGRGSNAQRFAHNISNPDKPGLLQARTSTGLTLQQHFPALKFIFPQAPLRRCTARKKMKMKIWFDSASFEDPSIREYLHIDGIAENARVLGRIIQAEAELVGLDKIFLGGLSEGCAMALYVMFHLRLEERPLAGFIGLSGWLPFQSRIDQILSGEEDVKHDDDDIFFVTENCQEEKALSNEDTKLTEVARFISEEVLDTEFHTQESKVLQITPIFIGHGEKDDVVPIDSGQRLVNTLQTLGFQVESKGYPDLGHWYEVPREVDDMARFLASQM